MADGPTRNAFDPMSQIDSALQANRPGLAEKLYRALLARDPGHREAYDGLLRLASHRPLHVESRRYTRSRRLLPPGFREFESKRFVVLSNANGQWTQAQLGRLERAHHQFQRWGRHLGLQPLPLRHKLVCVLFETREEYSTFSRNHDGVHDAWIFGYYSPRHDRTVFFNGEAEDGVDDFTRQRSIATTIHEALHQLLFHSRVQNPYVQYPIWLNEGLATAFETDTPSAAFGPEYEYEPRRDRFLDLLANGELLPLRALIQLDRMPAGNVGRVPDIYNQSYALVSWLARYRRAALREYLMLMLVEPPGRPSPERHLELFVRAFGDVERLEARWLRGERAQAGLSWNGKADPPPAPDPDEPAAPQSGVRILP